MLAAIDWHVIWSRIFHPNGTFAHALWATIYISIVAQVLGVLLGLIAALARMSRFWPFRWSRGSTSWIFRGTPRARADLLRLLRRSTCPIVVHLGGLQPDRRGLAGILALGINEGAYMREIIRAGIDSIDRGQMEAAKSLGMRYGLAMRRIVLPQAARVIVPPLGNEFNNMMKTTSLVFTIGVYELFADAEQGYSQTFHPRVLRRASRSGTSCSRRSGAFIQALDRAAARRERARRGADASASGCRRLDPVAGTMSRMGEVDGRC